MADLKTLKVCLSSDLPSLQDRDSNTIYFLRDKLIIYLGKSMYNDPYAIVEEMPAEPITGLLYFILSDGSVKSYMEYQVITIGQIEDEEQLELLKQTGSIFFVNSQRRYLDLARRIVTLPYNNGTYELTVDMANSLKINENTVIGFNPATNMFEMVGDSYDNIAFEYRGKESNSISTNVTDKRISAEVKISEVYNNIIRIANDGLYANVSDRVTKTQFNSWTESFKEYKSYMESYLKSLSDKIDTYEQVVTESTIREKILEALESEYEGINNSLDKFDEYSDKFKGIENRVKLYADNKFAEAYNDLSNIIIDTVENPWEEFTINDSTTGDDNIESGDETGGDDIIIDDDNSIESGDEIITENGEDIPPEENIPVEDETTGDENPVLDETNNNEEVLDETVPETENTDNNSSEITETDTNTEDIIPESDENGENQNSSTETENPDEISS